MALAVLLLLTHLAAQPDRFGLPACNAPHQELATRAAFILCFDSSTQTAVWSAYELKPEHLSAPRAPRPTHFRRDPQFTGPSDADYRNSGYSRGHLVPAADIAWNEQALAESFYLSNAVPENPSLNSGKWRTLENSIRKLAASSDSVIILTGPIFCETTERIGPHQVAVPCQLFKVALVIRDPQLTILAAVLPNDVNPSESLDHFFTTIDKIERLSHLHFFPSIQ